MYTGKRTFDILVASFALILAAPCIMLASILIFILSGSYPFFRQKRPGHLGIPFTLYKLKTLFKEDEVANFRFLRCFGRLLRTFSIDELPQLFNVLKGEMSIVGPRPLLMEYLPLYNLYQQQRHNVKPGITGWAQINGRNTIDWKKRFTYDIWYIQNQSFILDLKILVKTLFKIFRIRDVKPNGLNQQEKFKGN